MSALKRLTEAMAEFDRLHNTPNFPLQVVLQSDLSGYFQYNRENWGNFRNLPAAITFVEKMNENLRADQKINRGYSSTIDFPRRA